MRSVYVSALLASMAVSGGTLDAQVVTTPIGTSDDRAAAMAVQTDGKIVVAGRTHNGIDYDIAVARYLPTLALDTSFDFDGIVTTPVGASNDDCNAVAIQSDGKIVVAGSTHNGTNTDFALVRYNVDGSLDTNFDTDGIVITQFRSPDKQDIAYGIAFQSDGKIVATGLSNGNGSNVEVALARYNNNGSLDTSFDADGMVTTKVTNAFDAGYDVLVQPDGKIVVSGVADSGSVGDFVLLRYDASGTLDATFDADGMVTTDVGGFADSARGVLIQSDGKYVAGGDGTSQVIATRYDATGALDASFDIDGVAPSAAGNGQGAALQSDGKIIVPGTVGAGAAADFTAVRYNTNGSLDTSFDGDGIVTTDIGGANDQSFDATILADGRICLAGESNNGTDADFALVCYNTNGSLPAACSPQINYRSIGTDASILYQTGLATINTGTSTVTFTGGATLPTNIGRGDEIVIGATTFFILTRDSTTQVTVQETASSTLTDQSYTIRRAFNALQSWETAREGDLVTDNRLEYGLVYNDTVLNAGVDVDGSTTDACHYLALTVADGHRHTGVAGSGAVVDGLNDALGGGAIVLRDDYTRLTWLEVRRVRGTALGAIRVRDASNVLLSNLIIQDSIVGIDMSGTGGNGFTIRNSVIYKNDEQGIFGDETTDTIIVESCTVYGNGLAGIDEDKGSALTVTNTISMANGGGPGPDFNMPGGIQSFNISSDGTASGPGSLANRTATDNAFPGLGDWVVFTNLTATMEDFHLQTSAENDAVDGGTDLSASFSNDIDGQSRPDPSWDIGADELACKVYWGDEAPDQIGRAGVDGSAQEILLNLPATNVPRGLALDIASGKMYWAEGGTKIRRANLDGTSVEDLVTGLTTPRDVDLDPGVGKMYWTDSGTGKIQRANLDGTVVQDILTGLSTPRAGPALDLTAGKMYWTEDGSNRIRRANLDGTGIQNLVTTGLSGPFGIALDIGAGKMYWTDWQTAKVQRANLDGTSVQDLVTGLGAPRGIDLDLAAGKMYWVDYALGKLSRANLDGSNVEDIITTLSSPNSVALGCNIALALAPTAVELTSFTAAGGDGHVVLEWETGSEMNNLGFHLYRATTSGGRYERITSNAVPGLGSSPEGASYVYRDTDVSNGVTYYYQLEDVETTGRRQRHGPVSAKPEESGDSKSEPSNAEEGDTRAALTFNAPHKSSFRILPQENGVVLALQTGGFVAVPQDDGSVRLEVPGLEEILGTSLPVKRAWVEAMAGRNVEIVSVKARDVEHFSGLRSGGELVPSLEASSNGTVQARLVRRGRRLSRHESARLIEVAYQGETKKALFELSPFTWDGNALVLARSLEVYVAFRGHEPSGRRTRRTRTTAIKRLVTGEPGLYAVSLEEILGFRPTRSTTDLRLSRQGETIAHHVEGGVVYFWSEGASANPYGTESVYELELGVPGKAMEVVKETSGINDTFFWHEVEREENRYYQAGLVDAPDLWLWEDLFAPARKSFPFDVSEIADVPQSATLEIWLQGASDFPYVEDHHLRVYLNGSFVAETRWDGKNAKKLASTIGAGLLHDGENVLELETDATGATYSMVMLDRFRIRYRRNVSTLERASYVLDLSDASPQWVASRTGFDSTRVYVAVDGVRRPEIRNVPPTKLTERRDADYLVIGPQAFIDVAAPLLRRRAQQGLRVARASTEAIASEFGHGELTPEAIRDFIAYAYHEWNPPRLRYVLLLGDATYDFKDYLGTGVTNQIPPYMVRTSFLWTASDPAYGAVNGDDLLPDLAVGRLPAQSIEELKVTVAKILAFENDALSSGAPFVLVADDADGAGDFERSAEEIASTVLAGRETKRIYVRELGTQAARNAIVDSFDAGASVVSYLGHGAIHLWAQENIFDTSRVDGLAPQAQQPLVLTINCLNGYFHFPYFDSLAEALLKQPDKGAIAVFSPSGLSLSAAAHRYHQALLQELLNGAHERLGDAVLAAQKRYVDTGALPELLSIYHLFGDPALRLR